MSLTSIPIPNLELGGLEKDESPNESGSPLSPRNPHAQYSKKESEAAWSLRFVEAFGAEHGILYAQTFTKHCIPHDYLEPLTIDDLKEMEIAIAHRTEVLNIVARIRSATHGEGQVKNLSFSSGKLPIVEAIRRPPRSPDPTSDDPSSTGLGDAPPVFVKSFELQSTQHYLTNGFFWQDFEGVAETYESFLESVGEAMFSPNTRDEVPNHFMRAFWDNKPMPFFIHSHTKSGKVCVLLVLRLPSLELVQDPITIKDSTMATMTNRLVFIYTPRSTRGGKLITYHKDTTETIPWLRDVKAKWGELEDLSRERLFMHLVSQALLSSGQVLESYGMQLESLIDVPVSHASTSVVEWMSLINRQARVLKRCLVANSTACEGLTDLLQIDAQTTLHVAHDLAARSEETECNAMDAMNLRMGLCGFRANENMKFFTFVNAITAPIAVITGWYGMNFEFMPELKEENAYYILMSCVGVVIISMVSLIRYRHRDAEVHSEILIGFVRENMVALQGIAETKKSGVNDTERTWTAESKTSAFLPPGGKK